MNRESKGRLGQKAPSFKTIKLKDERQERRKIKTGIKQRGADWNRKEN